MKNIFKKLALSFFAFLFSFVFSSVAAYLLEDNLSSSFWVHNRASVKSREEVQEEEVEEGKKEIIFVGDMMFDRGVEAIIEEEGDDFVFGEIKEFFENFDLVVGNLEGPIVYESKDFPSRSIQFSFPQKVASFLREGGVTHLSLANNHTLNMERKGLEQTRDILGKQDISFFGDPTEEKKDYVLFEEDIVFIGLNPTYHSTFDFEVSKKLVKEVREEKPEKFLVVFAHWGKEYEPTSSSVQKELARGFVDAGADLVIGAHPHVVQEVEVYEEVPIFYSLGNFIFDQFFSDETQEGLGVGVSLKKDWFSVYLYPLSLEKAQPVLMEPDERESFLKKLSDRCAEDLEEGVMSGRMEFKRSKR